MTECLSPAACVPRAALHLAAEEDEHGERVVARPHEEAPAQHRLEVGEFVDR